MKKIYALIFNLIVPENHNRERIRSVSDTLSGQTPLLYFSLLANALALSATHVDVAPLPLVTTVPACLFFLCFVRIIYWWHLSRKDGAQKISHVRHILNRFFLALFVSAIFCLWAASLFNYGNFLQRIHVAVFIASCVYCVVATARDNRAAMSLASILLNLPFVLYFFDAQHNIFSALSVCIALTSMTCVAVLYFYFYDYKRLNLSRIGLNSEKKRNHRLLNENSYLLNIDSLTGLPNRNHFFKAIHVGLEEARQVGWHAAVGIIDLNGFKAINDLYGHSAGDLVLEEVGSRLRSMIDDDVLIARLGGDEFGCFMTGFSDRRMLEQLGERVGVSLALPMQIKNISTQITSSIGFAVYPEAGVDPSSLMERADYAMYAAKKSGERKVSFFSPEHEADMRGKRLLQQALRQARLEEELQVVFQPIVHSDKSVVVAFEALARWNSPLIGKVPPDQFIRAAEEINIIGDVTRVLFRKAITVAALWPKEIGLSFNLSAHDVISGDFNKDFRDMLGQAEFCASRLTIEVTETSLLNDFAAAVARLGSLREAGVKIALDDFGTGYSSLGYIHQLPIDKVKVDRCFIEDIDKNIKSQAIVKTVIQLCKNLSLDCIVEGVEKDFQFDLLCENGPLYLQGYKFGRPVSEPVLAGLATVH
jgi:diguanylate cyclase (GGDEF)-like protein